MTVANISWLITMKVWCRADTKLTTPGSAIGLTGDCTTATGKKGLFVWMFNDPVNTYGYNEVVSYFQSWPEIKGNLEWMSIYHGSWSWHSLVQNSPNSKQNWEILWVKLEVTWAHPILTIYLLESSAHNQNANRLDPDQAQQNVGPDLDPICLTLRWYSWKKFSKYLILKKKSADDKKAWKISQGAKS